MVISSLLSPMIRGAVGNGIWKTMVYGFILAIKAYYAKGFPRINRCVSAVPYHECRQNMVIPKPGVRTAQALH